MPWNVGVGYIVPDAVPGSMVVDSGFQESETAADALSARSCECLGCKGTHPGSLRFRVMGTNRRRGIVHGLLEKCE